jgi:hypothetical protein
MGTPMSPRGRILFDKYVSGSLNSPDLMGLGIGTHVFNLTSEAAAAHIPTCEVTEEVGPLGPALISARKP